eukprot:scaffold2271_cov130-Cylindrotheca_fusiformis.AAC.12
MKNSANLWSPSQYLVLKMIISLLNLCPSLPLRQVFSAVSELSFPPTQMNRLVSVTFTLAQDCPRFRSDSIQTMLHLIRIIDDELRTAEPTDEMSPTSENSCEFCRQHREKLLRRPRKRARYTLSDLHDEDHSHANSYYFTPRSSLLSRLPQTKISLRKVLRTDRRTKERECICNKKDMIPVLKEQKLTTVQFRAYKKLVRLATSHHCPLRILVGSSGNHKHRDYILSMRIRDWMRIIFQHPRSPSLRLGLLFSATLNQPQEIVSVYWQAYLRAANPLSLRFLSELIASSSYFDHPQHCWMAVHPLWEYVLLLADTDGCCDLFVTLAHLLATRGPLLKYEDKVEFSSLLKRTRLQYGQVEFWKLALPQFTVTLQEYAILGLVELSLWEESASYHGSDLKQPEETDCSIALSRWPFEESYSLPGAFLRLTSTNKKDDQLPKEFSDCLSSPTHYENLVAASARHSNNLSENVIPPKPVPPLLDHLNGDIQRSVMGYLNHVELARARLVCQYWKSVIDAPGKASLWHQAYVQGFGPYKEESTIQEGRDWMALFRVKYLNEQVLKFQRNKTTAYKHRTCCYLGCLRVLKSEKQQVQHEERHVREQEKERQRRNREEEKKLREEEKLFVKYLKEQAKLQAQSAKRHKETK